MSLGLMMGISFASAFLKGVSESNQAEGGVQAYRQQASVYRQNARQARLNGAVNEDIMRMQNRGYLSSAAAAGSEAGMGESSTFVSALASSAAALEQNVLYRRYETESEAENYLYQARVADYNAKQMKKKARNLFSQGLVNGIGSALMSGF